MEKIINKLSNISIPWKGLQALPSRILIFSVLAFAYLSFVPNDNEEQYMQLAKQFFDPNWIKNSQNLTEFSGSRVLYQYLVGFFLQFLSFEKVVFIFRLLLILLISDPLSKLYNELRLTNFQILLHLPILYLLNQSLFAGSWIFVSVEPKMFAYIFILYALLHFTRRHFMKMTIFILIGTYFHILVGGYAFIYFMLCLFLFENRQEYGKLIWLSVGYIILTIPFIYYLKSSTEVANHYQPSADWIYSYFRTPHHTALFSSLIFFYNTHFYGILLSCIGLLFCIKQHGYFHDPNIRMLNKFVIVSMLGTLILVPLAVFDKSGVFLKYYPYRINALSTFCLMLILSKWLFTIIKVEFYNNIKLYIVIFSLFFLSKAAIPNLIYMINYSFSEKTRLANEVCDYIQKNTNDDDVIFTLEEDLTLIRKCRRNMFVVYKYIPAEMDKIHSWYERILTKFKILENFENIKEAAKQYKIDYILSNRALHSVNYIEKVYSNEDYYLYKVKIERSDEIR